MSELREERACLICGTEGALVIDPPAPGVQVVCGNCGEHWLSGSAEAELRAQPLAEVPRARLAHAVVRMPAGTRIGTPQMRSLIETTALPAAAEQLDNLVLHLAATLRPGELRTLPIRHLVATIGAVTVEETKWVVEEALRAGWLRANGGVTTSPDGWELPEATLSAAGWQRHADLLRNGARSRHAFMAMKFGDPDLDALLRDHLKPAVAQAGFELRAANDRHQTAGSIDNRMRVEIRTSRFVVCDLTHGNRGAYWEAGFAEGLGRPVFYICRADVLASTEPDTRPHFDTAHQLIIPWDPAAPARGMQQLKDAIRATLPAEAKLED